MKQNDDEKFATIMAAMASAYQVNISEATTGMYFMFLKDLHFDKVQKAMVEIMATESAYKLPSIADIRKKALGVEDERIDDEAMEAWGEVLQTVKYSPIKETDEEASYQKMEYEHGSASLGAVISHFKVRPDVHKAVRMAFGGWLEFSKREIKDETWDRLHFIRCYKSIAKEVQKKLLLGSGEIKLLKE